MTTGNLWHDIALFFTHPWISALLILILIGGIIGELKAPGSIVPLLTGMLAATAYFGSYYLLGLTEWWEVIIFAAGFLLVAAEIFVLPGFGILGISGIILLISGLVLAAIPNKGMDFEQVHTADAVNSLIVVLAGVIGGIVALLLLAKYILNSRFFYKAALNQALDSKDGYAVGKTLQTLVGKQGLVRTVLRPSGKIEIEGKLYEATSLDSFVEAGKWVHVIDVRGNMLRVRVAANDTTSSEIVQA